MQVLVIACPREVQTGVVIRFVVTIFDRESLRMSFVPEIRTL
jgi:hypothetical protein